MTFIAAQGVSKSFGGAPALRDVSCTIERRARVCIVGANGAGKSTFLRCLSGLERPDWGEVRIDGERLSDTAGFSRLKKKLRVGFFGQAGFLYSNLTVFENLELLARLYHVKESKAVIEQLAAKLALGTALHKLPRECSQGLFRRAAFARAVVNSPSLLLLDEPLAHLDTDGVGRVCAFLRELVEEGTTVVCASHEPWFVREFAERTITFERGRIVSDEAKTAAAAL